MKVLITTIVILGLVLINSCDCLLHVQGVVTQSDRAHPVDSVKITRNVKNDSTIILTDKHGRFDYNLMVLSMFGCPRIRLSFEKDGFETINKIYRPCCTDNDTIVLKRIKTE